MNPFRKSVLASSPMLTAEDREFLPAALSIIETPPSPIKIRLMTTIAAMATFALAISFIGRIDIVAEAHGKVQPAGRVKVVQPLDPGRVFAVRVENGSKVKAGDVLIELDATQANAEQSGAESAYSAFLAESLRRHAEIEAALDGKASATIAWPDIVPTETRIREEAVLRGDLSRLTSMLSSDDAQAASKQTEIDRLQATIGAQDDLLKVQQERIEMRNAAIAKQVGTKTNLLDAEEARRSGEVTLRTQKGQLAQAKADLEVLIQGRRKELDAFVSEQSQKFADASRQADDAKQKANSARAKTEHMTVRAPISGTVTSSSVINVGQVLSAGEDIMRVVPDDVGIEIEGYVQNMDIGFIRPGQLAEIKVDSFPYTRYGTIPATVKRVADDAVPEADVASSAGSPGKTSRETSTGGVQRLQSLVYQVSLDPNRNSIMVDGAERVLTPGMSVSIEIKTGSRRIIDYLISPLIDTGKSAMRDR